MVARLETHQDGRPDVSTGLVHRLQCCLDRGVTMSSITIELQEQQIARLQEIASRLGVSIEALARVSIEDLLAAPDERFEQAADYVLKKNEDLYRRLA